jgi:hypothetical protein
MASIGQRDRTAWIHWTRKGFVLKGQGKLGGWSAGSRWIAGLALVAALIGSVAACGQAKASSETQKAPAYPYIAPEELKAADWIPNPNRPIAGKKVLDPLLQTGGVTVKELRHSALGAAYGDMLTPWEEPGQNGGPGTVALYTDKDGMITLVTVKLLDTDYTAYLVPFGATRADLLPKVEQAVHELQFEPKDRRVDLEPGYGLHLVGWTGNSRP